MAKLKLFLIILTLVLASFACTNGTGGSVTGSRQTCKSVSGAGTCEGEYKKLSGTYTHKIELDSYNQGDTVLIDAVFGVQSGRLLVSLEAPDGTLSSAEVSPGSPASVSGLAVIDDFMDDLFIPITLEAITDDVGDIEFSISFRNP